MLRLYSPDNSGLHQAVKILLGAMDMRSPPLEGGGPQLCAAFFSEKKKIMTPAGKFSGKKFLSG